MRTITKHVKPVKSGKPLWQDYVTVSQSINLHTYPILWGKWRAGDTSCCSLRWQWHTGHWVMTTWRRRWHRWSWRTSTPCNVRIGNTPAPHQWPATCTPAPEGRKLHTSSTFSSMVGSSTQAPLWLGWSFSLPSTLAEALPPHRCLRKRSQWGSKCHSWID